MKALIIITLAVVLSGCAISKTPQSEVNEKVKKIQSTAWYQRMERM